MHLRCAWTRGPASAQGSLSPGMASTFALVALWLLATSYLAARAMYLHHGRPGHRRAPGQRGHLHGILSDARWRAAAVTLTWGSPAALLLVWLTARQR